MEGHIEARAVKGLEGIVTRTEAFASLDTWLIDSDSELINLPAVESKIAKHAEGFSYVLIVWKINFYEECTICL